jgi:hypothetical protein
MAGRLIELAVSARRLVTAVARAPRTAGGVQLTARRQLGGRLTQFSFRLAFVLDLAYVGMGALGGAAVARAASASSPSSTVAANQPAAPACQR